jgi:hypothetical protein
MNEIWFVIVNKRQNHFQEARTTSPLSAWKSAQCLGCIVSLSPPPHTRTALPRRHKLRWMMANLARAENRAPRLRKRRTDNLAAQIVTVLAMKKIEKKTRN